MQPKAGSAGDWRLIGQTHADHGADHDSIIVKGPFDNFRKIKFKVTDAAAEHAAHGRHLRQRRAGQDRCTPEHPAGRGKPRIDLRGIGKRSVRRIDFWYDTKGFLKGKADVTVFGMK